MESTNMIQAAVFAILVSAGKAVAKCEKAFAKAESTATGAYDTIMQAAAEAGEWPVFESAMKELEAGIRTNVETDGAPNGLATLFGAEKGKNKDGTIADTWNIPRSLTRAKTAVKRAFKHGVSVVDENGAPRPYNAVQKETAKAAKAAKKAGITAEVIATLSGDDLLRAEIGQALHLLLEMSNKATGAELAELHTFLCNLSGLTDQKADEVTGQADDAGDALAAAA